MLPSGGVAGSESFSSLVIACVDEEVEAGEIVLVAARSDVGFVDGLGLRVRRIRDLLHCLRVLREVVDHLGADLFHEV